MDCSVIATFPDARRAAIVRQQISHYVALSDIKSPALDMAKETAGEARYMGRIVIWIVLASAVGTGLGAALGALFAYTFGPHGTSGYVIQIVSWAIFMHLLIGMWAGYAFLADRSGRELRDSGPVTLTVRCAKIDAAALSERLLKLGATEVEIRDGAAKAAAG
ncbi:MAG: hypothetical protein ABI559_03220 [Chloroflexota bacterium]